MRADLQELKAGLKHFRGYGFMWMFVVNLPASGSAKPVVLADVGPRRVLQPVGAHDVLRLPGTVGSSRTGYPPEYPRRQDCSGQSETHAALLQECKAAAGCAQLHVGSLAGTVWGDALGKNSPLEQYLCM